MQHPYPLNLQCDYSLIISSGEKDYSRKNMQPSTRTAAAIAKLHIQDQFETESHTLQSE